MGDIVFLKYDDNFKQLFLNEEVRRYFISDALGIPVEEIRSVRLANTFLWKQFRWQKQGILDVLLELNVFSENMRVGQDYTKLKRCVCISILGFNLDENPKYHRIYRLRDEDGEEYSDLIEIQVIELNKLPNGQSRMDNWIRLFNAKTKEELDMLEAKTKNRGILEAIKEVRVMSLGQRWKMMYGAHMKLIRDQHARDDYVRNEGRAEGRAEGKIENILQLLQETGSAPEDLRTRIRTERDPETLDRWLLIAARAESIESFRERAGI